MDDEWVDNIMTLFGIGWNCWYACVFRNWGFCNICLYLDRDKIMVVFELCVNILGAR